MSYKKTLAFLASIFSVDDNQNCRRKVLKIYDKTEEFDTAMGTLDVLSIFFKL